MKNIYNLILLGTAIKHYRLKLGISQEKLAFNTGLHRTYISDCERGQRNISFNNIVLISKALNIFPSELFAYIERISENES